MRTSCQITGQTKLCGIIGDPVEHTISPALHNAAFKAVAIDYIYLPFRVKKEDLTKAVDGVRALNIRGLNVTIPHKVEIMPLLDKIDPLARKIGAVNVIVNDNGLLTGFNTDADGFLCALVEQGIEPKGQNAVIIGAGGASRAICFALAGRGASLTIVNRSSENAARCATDIFNATGQAVEVRALDRKNLVDVLSKCNILVNTSSMGMIPNTDNSPVDRHMIRPRLIVVDIVYNPLKTKLLTEAEKAGAKTVNGLEMLIWQGALAFEKWTGSKAPLDVMRKEATGALKQYEK